MSALKWILFAFVLMPVMASCCSRCCCSSIYQPITFYSNVTWNDTVWDDMRVPLVNAKTGGIHDPTFVRLARNKAASSEGVYGYIFDDSIEEELFFDAQMPHSYKEGTTIHSHVHFTPWKQGTDVGNVRWCLEYIIADIDENFANETTITCGDYYMGVGNDYTHLYLDIGNIEGTDYKISNIIIGRVYRAAADQYDSYPGGVVLHEIDFHFEIDTLGSSTELNK